MQSFQEGHSSEFSGHTGRDNTIKKIKDKKRIKQTIKSEKNVTLFTEG